MNIKPGKYLTRDCRKAIVRHAETELPCICSARRVLGYVRVNTGYELWELATWDSSGSESPNQASPRDLVSEGWPLELVAGRWYRDDLGEDWLLHATPNFYEFGRWAAYRKGDCPLPFKADGTNKTFGQARRLIEEIEPPAWAKETT